MIAEAQNLTAQTHWLDQTAAALADLASRSGPQRGPQRRSVAVGVPHQRFAYDAVEDKDRRKPPPPRTRSEDKQLTPSQRKRLTATTRDIRRNFAIAAWMIRKHLDYVSTFTFQSRTGIRELDERIEELFRWWSRPQNCDVAGRHNLQRIIRLAEERRTIDGDVFLLKLSDGRIQAIEGDRVRTPSSGLPEGVSRDEFIHGVQVDRHGRAKAYSKRSKRCPSHLA